MDWKTGVAIAAGIAVIGLLIYFTTKSSGSELEKTLKKFPGKKKVKAVKP